VCERARSARTNNDNSPGGAAAGGSSLYTPYYVILNGGHAPRLIFTLLFIPRVTKRNSLRQTRLAQTGSLLSEPFHLRRANNLLRFSSFFLFSQYALHYSVEGFINSDRNFSDVQVYKFKSETDTCTRLFAQINLQSVWSLFSEVAGLVC
jgi:hypothetical protein